MKNIFTITNLCLLLLCAVALAGCVKRELEKLPGYKNGTLELTTSWPEGVVPAGARLLIYSKDGEFLEKHEISGTDSVFLCELEAGDYRIIMHNTNGQNTYFHNTDKHTTALVCAYPNVIPQAGAELIQPSNIFGVGAHDQGQIITIKEREVTAHKAVAERLTRQVAFYFKITGLETIEQIKGRLIGVSPGVLLGSGIALPVSCLQSYVATYLVDRKPLLNRSPRGKAITEEMWYETKIEFFDLMAQTRPDQTTSTQLSVAITDGQGQIYQITTDITSIVQDIILENGGFLPVEIPLEVDLNINASINNITVSVTPWDETGTGDGNPRPKIETKQLRIIKNN